MRPRRSGTTNEPLSEFSSLEELSQTAHLNNGRFSVEYQNFPVDYSFRNHESTTMVVTYHGAALKTVNMPWFTGKGIMEGVNAKWLALSDPTLAIDNELGLSWFAGSARQPDLQGFNAKVIDTVMQLHGAENLIFLGGSGGGFATLEASRRFPGSLAIPMNPQTSIGIYYEGFVNTYLTKAWDADSLADEELSAVVHDLVSAYHVDHSNTIAYVQNTRDTFHIRKHQRPLLHKLSGSKAVWRLEQAWGDPTKTGHVIPPKDEVSDIVKAAASSSGDWETALQSVGFRQDL